MLIPAAAKLYGRYNDQLSYGQRRAPISWTRILFPDGSSQNIGSMAGTDGSGAAGIEGEVDRHWGAMAGAIGGTALFAVLGQAGAILRGSGGTTPTSAWSRRRRRRCGVAGRQPAASTCAPSSRSGSEQSSGFRCRRH